jgi:hypothetical protein
MATLLSVKCNLVDADVDYATTPADYISLDLTNDYLIWSEDLDDLMTTVPTADELNAHAVIISDDAEKLVPECLVMDYSGDWNGHYHTHLVIGMGENKRYAFAFSFDGATANEPQLEAWDDVNHDTFDKNVLGLGIEGDSMVKAICTSGGAPGSNWALTGGAGIAIAGDSSTRVVQLNDGNGALPILETGETSQELYANIAIVIPIAYATPAVESFVLTVRYTWQ